MKDGGTRDNGVGKHEDSGSRYEETQGEERILFQQRMIQTVSSENILLHIKHGMKKDPPRNCLFQQ